MKFSLALVAFSFIAFSSSSFASAPADPLSAICSAIHATFGDSAIPYSDCLADSQGLTLTRSGCPLTLSATDPTIGPGQPNGDGQWARCKQLQAEGDSSPIDFALFYDGGPLDVDCVGTIKPTGVEVLECPQDRHD